MNKIEVEWEPLSPAFKDVPTIAPAVVRTRGISRPATVKVVRAAHGERIVPYECCGSVETYVDVIDGRVVLCEWHDADCENLPLIREDACHGILEPGMYCGECGTYNPNEPGE